MPAVRPVLLALVLAVALPVATADAQYQPYDDPAAEEGWWPGDPVDPPEATAEAEAADPTEPAVVAPPPTQVTFPPTPAGDPGEDLPPQPEVELVRTAMVPGRTARLRTDGRAAIPRGAPKTIRTLIAAMNRIVGKPYKWGGGHARLIDRGYDCSGAVSYGLIGAGMLRAPQVSGTLARFGATGAGRWVTVYANKGHVYLEVAGLRLDTSPVGDRFGGRNGVRWRSVIGRRPGFAVRHPIGY